MPGPPRRILLVDDDPALLSALGQMLSCRLRHVVVDCESSSPAAWSRARDDPYDLIVCDVRMPEADGLTFLTAVKVAHPTLPVILITASIEDSINQEARRRGALDVVRKPLDRDAFLALVQSILRID